MWYIHKTNIFICDSHMKFVFNESSYLEGTVLKTTVTIISSEEGITVEAVSDNITYTHIITQVKHYARTNQEIRCQENYRQRFMRNQ